MNRLFIIGAGGHGKVVADIALKNGYTDIAFLDDKVTGECMGFPILGSTKDSVHLKDGKTDFVIAVGNNGIRKKIAETYAELSYATLIHPSAVIGYSVEIGKGTVVMAGAIVNPSVSIGKHCIINTAAVIEHDNVLANYVHISPNAALGGAVYIGQETHIGIGATVRNNVNVCSRCVVGAGAVVVKDIIESDTYIGIPAIKKIVQE